MFASYQAAFVPWNNRFWLPQSENRDYHPRKKKQTICLKYMFENAAYKPGFEIFKIEIRL